VAAAMAEPGLSQTQAPPLKKKWRIFMAISWEFSGLYHVSYLNHGGFNDLAINWDLNSTKIDTMC